MGQEIITKTGMSAAEGAAWWFAIILTCGLAYPLYRARKHHLGRVSKTKIR